MSEVIKITDSTELKLKELMKSLKARKIFKIYLDGKVEIDE